MEKAEWEGILLRHLTVESAAEKIDEAAKQGYLCHLDRAALIEEVRRLSSPADHIHAIGFREGYSAACGGAVAKPFTETRG